MSQGSYYDNAPIESFFHTVTTEPAYFKKFQIKKEAKLAIFEYIEHFYNRKRLHSSLGYRSPEPFEKAYDQQKLRVSCV